MRNKEKLLQNPMKSQFQHIIFIQIQMDCKLFVFNKWTEKEAFVQARYGWSRMGKSSPTKQPPFIKHSEPCLS